MAALNKQETEDLRKITNMIRFIQLNGYLPLKEGDERKDRRPSDAHLDPQLELARRRLHTLVTMKGYYPK